MSKRLMILIGLLAFMAIFLVACGDDTGTPTTTSTTTTSTTTTRPESETPQQPSNTGDPVVVGEEPVDENRE